MADTVERMLDTHPFSCSLPDEARRSLAARVELVELGVGDVVVREGEDGDAAYLVTGGRLVVSVGDRIVGEIGRGETVGEMALFLGQRRTATVTVRRPSTLLRIGAAQFAEVLSAHPAVHQAVTRQLVTRLDRAQRHVAGSREPAIVAVLGAGSGASADARVHEIASRLASILRTAGHPAASCVMDPDLDASRLERAGELVLVAGTAADLDVAPHWFDRVLLVVDGSARPEWVARLPRCGATDLVLLHPASTLVPTGSAQLIDAAGVTEHHHLREGHPGDMARLARRLVGREHVLVLGGGGARGMAHLGTYRALVEAGIPIDVVAGVSAGALFAAAIALDWSPEQAVERSVAMLVDAGRLVDLTIPAVALSSGRRITEGIQRAFGAEVDMEDLWRPMFCVAADLTTLTPSVLRKGRLWRAVRATVGVPGVFPPLVEGESVLVDGGVIDNLPVERARRMYPGAIVIASDVGRRREQLRFGLPGDGIVPGWRSVWHRLSRRGRTPGLVGLLYRLTALGAAAEGGGRGDLHIEHDVAIGMFDFARSRSAIEDGYRTTRAALADWEPPATP